MNEGFFTRDNWLSGNTPKYDPLIITKPSTTQLTMTFFFIGGLEPSITKTVQSNVGPCPYSRCSGQLDLVEISTSLKLFWVPVLSYDPQQLYHCRRCKATIKPKMYNPVDYNDKISASLAQDRLCADCGTKIESGWHFCPTCGSSSA